MSLTLTVHRGTQQIGGSCIEITHPQGDRIILDAGRPLDAPDGATGLLPPSLDRSRPATVLISHPHQDSWGLVEELPVAWPVWTGSGLAKLIAVTGDVTRRPLTRTFETWDSRSGPFSVGPCNITPILTDHSAFDAYMVLVEGSGEANAPELSGRQTYRADARNRPIHCRCHYDRWQEWQALGGAGRALAGYPDRIASTEYEVWPRGRIIYETPARRFVLYADRRLQQPTMIDALKTAFVMNRGSKRHPHAFWGR